MKNKTKIMGLIAVITITLQSHNSFAQWQIGFAGFPSYGRTDPALNIFGVGIGDFPNGTPPLSALHINTNPPFIGNPFWDAGEVFRTDCPSNVNTYWRMLRDNAQFGSIFNRQDNHFETEATQGDFLINALGTGANAQIRRRMRITSGNGLFSPNNAIVTQPNISKVVIERAGNSIPLVMFQNPLAMLNIGNDGGYSSNQGGWRNWFDVGTFSVFGSDYLYTGLKVEPHPFNDNYDAVISWGDNTAGQSCCGPDNLRFIFTTTLNSNSNPESLPDGSEIARMTPEGFVGIGNYTLPGAGGGSGIQPLRRLEVYDQRFNGNTPASAPQLRLTHTPNQNVNLGINTDFQVTANGDLFINPRANGINRFTGINTSTPGNTLEINSTTGVSPQLAGLRFTNLTNNISPIVNPSAQRGVLSVDQNGDVIWVIDQASSGGTITSTCANPWFLPKLDNPNTGNLVCSQVYDNNRTVSIGHYLDQDLFYKFEVTGESVFSLSPNPNLARYKLSNTRYYPLMVKSSRDQNAISGLAILSSANNPQDQDALNIYSDGNSGNMLHYESIGNNSVFRDRKHNTSLLGFIPSMHTTVVKSDFEQNPIAPSVAPLYAEAQFGQGIVKSSGIHGSNRTDDALVNLSGWWMNGVFGESTFRRTLPNVDNNGAFFLANGASRFNRGLIAVANEASNATRNYGVDIWTSNAAYGRAPSVPGTVNINRGVNSRVWFLNASAENMGGFFEANGGGKNYGVYAKVFGLYPNNVAGFFNGPVFTSQLQYYSSDSTIKTNIVMLPDTFDILTNLNVYSYQFDSSAAPSLNLPAGTHFGLISQEVETILPQFVRTFTQPAELDSSGNIIIPSKDIKGISYESFIGPLIHGHQQQSRLLDSLFTRLDSIQQQINSCCNLRLPDNNPAVTGSIEPENIKSLQLFTADPNPFSESTIIRWSITNDFINAVIYFYDDRGQQINQYRIAEKGNGELQLFGSKLSSGVYTYTLVVDGKIVESRKMVKVK